MIIGQCPVCGADMRVGSDMTNSDRIRSMTDEELANLLAHKVDACHNCSNDSVDTCVDCWLEWLKKEDER